MTLNTTTLPAYLQAQLPYINDNQSIEYIVVTAICLPAAWIAVFLRLISRHYSAMRYGQDDWAIIVGLILGSAWSIDACISSTFGAGRHAIFLVLNPETFVAFAKNSIAELTLVNPVLFAVKLSILLLYGRIFTNRRFHISLWVVGTFTALCTIAATICSLVMCIPLEKLCANVQSKLTIFGILNILTDSIVLAMPAFMILRLQMDRTTKIQIIGLFLTGGLVTIISIIRVVYTSLIGYEDGTWNGSISAIWSIAEINTAIISACLPTYRPLFDKSKRRASRQCPRSSKRTTYLRTGSDLMEQSLRKIHVQTSITNTWSGRDESPDSSITTVPEEAAVKHVRL